VKYLVILPVVEILTHKPPPKTLEADIFCTHQYSWFHAQWPVATTGKGAQNVLKGGLLGLIKKISTKKYESEGLEQNPSLLLPRTD